MIITRKIEVYVNEPEKEEKKVYYDRLFKWLRICRVCANQISSHLYYLDNAKDFFYLTEEVKKKLTDIKKDPDGMLLTSYQNSGYQLLSSLFKGEIPSSILSCLNQAVSKTYKEERADVIKGDRSVRSYRNNIPIPFGSRDIRNLKKIDKDYIFEWFNTPIKTKFGRDRSGNEFIIDRVVSGEYKLCGSSFLYNKRKNKWFLLASIDIPNTRMQHKEGLIVEADLNMLVPIIAKCNEQLYEIGSKEEFLYNRIGIQHSLNNLQKSLKYCTGGNGRKAKLAAIERFHLKENNYITTKMHTYSMELIRFAIRCRSGIIVLKNQKIKEELAKENQPVLRNWSYYGLKQMIEYKAKRTGIDVRIE